MTTTRIGSKHLIREINEALVLDQLRVHTRLSRATIANQTGLSPATITGITAKLSQAGLISEVELGTSRGGRPPRMLALNPAGGHVLGVRLAADHLVIASVNLLGETTAGHTIKWQNGSASEAVTAVVDAAAEFAQADSTLLGLGVALSGSVDYPAGIVRHSGALGWTDVPLRDMLSEHFDVPVVIDRHVNAMATSLALFSKEHQGQDLLIVNVGPSLGTALVQNGQIHRGAGGGEGGLAHTSVSVLSERGQRCHCGATGCLDTVASEWGMTRELQRTTGQRLKLATAVKRAADDPSINQVIRRGGQALGRAVANVAKVVNPHQVVIGGDATKLGPAFLEPLEKDFHAACRHGAGHDYELCFASFDEVSWARGAACQVLATMFSVP